MAAPLVASLCFHSSNLTLPMRFRFSLTLALFLCLTLAPDAAVGQIRLDSDGNVGMAASPASAAKLSVECKKSTGCSGSPKKAIKVKAYGGQDEDTYGVYAEGGGEYTDENFGVHGSVTAYEPAVSYGIYGEADTYHGTEYAGYFDGDVTCNRDVLLSGIGSEAEGKHPSHAWHARQGDATQAKNLYVY